MDTKALCNLLKHYFIVYLIFFKTTSTNVPSLTTVEGENELPGKLQTNNFRLIGEYKILKPDTRCKITKCHGSTVDTRNYHSYCFEEQCSYGSFHCIHGSGKVITFCAEFKDCALRYRHIAVLNKQRPGYVDIYEIHCEVGFFQKNDRHSCFTPCAKDTSITLIESSGVNSIKLAFCKPELGCNPHGRMFFELDTKYDDCTGSIHCPPSLDRLPDCSCDEPCPPNFERIPENNFSCSSRNGSTNDEHTIPSNGGSSRPETPVEDDVEENPSIVETDDVKGDKNEETTQDNLDKEIDDMVNLKEENNNEESNSSSNDYALWAPGVAVIVIVITGIVAIFLRGLHKHYIAVSGQTDPEAPDRRSCLDKTHSGTNKTTTIFDNSTVKEYTINRVKYVNINTWSRTTDHSLDADIEPTENQQDEQRMELLEEPVLNGGDTSVTQPKQLYSS